LPSKRLSSFVLTAILVISLLAAFSMFAMSSVQASPADYWVEAGATGDGMSEATPAGNITYVLTTYAGTLTSGDVIKVKPGTYNVAAEETFPITINVAGLIIESVDGTGATIIDGGGGTSLAVHIQLNATLRGFTIKNFKALPDAHIGAILVEGDNARIENNIIEDITNASADPAGIGIDAHAKDVKITNNTVHDVGSIGIRVRHDWNTPPIVSNNILVGNNTVYRTNNTGVLVTGYAKGVTIKNNEIYESLEPTPYNLFVHYGASDVIIENNNIHDPYNSIYGHNIVLAGCDNITITGNNIANTTSAKNIYLLNDYNSWTGDPTLLSTNVSIVNNNIQNGKWGIRLLYTAAGDPSQMAATTTINFNNIVGNAEYGVENTIGTDADAECNWWGDATGPNAATNPGGTGDNVSDNVTYRPWSHWEGQSEAETATTTVSGTDPPNFDATAKADTEVDLSGLGVGASGSMAVAKYPATPSTATTLAHDTGKTALKYVDVQVGNLTQGNALIKVHYTSTGGLEESSLRLYYWDGSSWVESQGSSVDTANDYVQGIVPVTKLTGTPCAAGGSPPAPPAVPVPEFNAIGLLASIGILTIAIAFATLRKRE